ncbi:ActS/PrrB/RegB family redox-sensitive histidine kinase [Paradevosia shaoguanensis]|jgi:two-component system sensor histidine kinase RegB|uniref:histidine kinase n=1 Tax=Paradevosia shaoguanensis TaxID=1335043 RepID=A0AA41QPA6_9HYPH|nr:ActS/PrrB/RegB family redox-sensitive histidine kinase [Paradevosia shaoguanensis]MCF1744029.1 ActS/PrrB/RegB family redox-sensitive histidine kinase [Paradevosia shaoguanensis]MCI0128512.1 ActS/PrrB/RegB family redox-sensitive histidine kinase [Paradevosia shaoguanensis]QMV03967.1 ActS/PrrB/RegB family redox-sensitive histidine kinase [Devosia sp. D6-9]CDP52089.1 Sensor histidine kinase PrrB (RegB) [Devosia sp. DBB001]
MTVAAPPSTVQPTPNFRPIRLETLVWLRWLAVGGQIVAVLFVEFVLGYPTPLAPCLALIGLSVVMNLFFIFRYGAGDRLRPEVAAFQLAYDCLQLGALLALTGGLQNPFSLLLLAPISVSATTLPQRATVYLVILVAVIASILSVWHMPLPWKPGTRLVFDRLYVVGIWVALLCGMVFIATYINRVAHEARQLADALNATELALSRHEQLNALDGLAAAAAHELGTPLSTIALVAKEMRAEVPSGPLAEDVDLLIEQSQRCGAILAKLRDLGAERGDPFAAAPLADILAEVAKPHQKRKTIRLETQGDPETAPTVKRNAGLLYGLGNLIENATEFAHQTVTVRSAWDAMTVTVTITDDGPGFPPELMARLGEPYLTTRARVEGSDSGGLGLGIFIAKTLLERTGAQIRFQNVHLDRFAQVQVVWPRKVIEQSV